MWSILNSTDLIVESTDDLEHLGLHWESYVSVLMGARSLISRIKHAQILNGLVPLAYERVVIFNVDVCVLGNS